MVDARMDVHGPPPQDIQAQRDWYQDALRETLKLAAKTRLVMPTKSEQQRHTETSDTISPASFNTGGNGPAIESQSQQSDLTMSPLTYDPQQVGLMDTLEPANIDMGTGNVVDSYLYFPQPLSDGNGPLFQPQYNFQLPSDFGLLDETPRPNNIGQPQYLQPSPPPPAWSGQERRR